ncbi:MAG: hypothetical protein ACI8XU_001071 [Kiritimatiellia bacterium]|jgi:hypothetical protein
MNLNITVKKALLGVEYTTEKLRNAKQISKNIKLTVIPRLSPTKNAVVVF